MKTIKHFEKVVRKTSKMVAEIETNIKPYDVVIICNSFIVATDKAKKYFNNDIDEFDSWIESSFLSPPKFASMVRKRLNDLPFKIDWLTGFAFAYDWSISTIKAFEHKTTTPFTMDVRFSYIDNVEQDDLCKPEMCDRVKMLYDIVNETFTDINKSSNGFVNIHYD
jgi:hypothetical protein